MKKFKVTAVYTDYIYAENEEEALEEFDELMADDHISPADEILVEEMPSNT